MSANSKIWLLEGALLALSLWLFSVYAQGQWDHTVKFFNGWLAG